MKISSSAFADGKPIPTKYAYPGVVGGKNISIPLAWSGAPPETRSFALSIVDPHPVANNWVHWFVINIPASATSLPEGASGKAMPKGAGELYNTYGTLGYDGPEPPQATGPLLPGAASGTAMTKAAGELYRTAGTLGSGAPEPPKGSGPHPYEVTLYALNVE